MYGTKPKKFDGWVANEDGNGGEDDATALPEDHEGGPEDGYGAPLEDHGYGAPLENRNNAPIKSGPDVQGGDGDKPPKEDDKSIQGDETPKEDGKSVPPGRRRVQLLRVLANFAVARVNVYDSHRGQTVYTPHPSIIKWYVTCIK